ncbi:MAG: hypothetical protein ACM3X3_07480 [Betaproteobacteria bacterium]
MKCRQTLKAVTEILQHDFPGPVGDGVCSAVSRCLGGVRVYLVDAKGQVTGRSMAASASAAAKALADSPGPEVHGRHFGDGLTPRTIASLGAAVAARRIAVSAVIDRHTYAAAPITVLREALGMLVVQLDREPSRDDLDTLGALATAAGAVLAIRHWRDEEERERNQRGARSAIRSLSYSELVAVRAILDSIAGDQGFVIAGRIADAAGMTRSVVVNALRKLSSADLVRTKSLGMKGMFVKLLNPELRSEVQNSGIGRDGARAQVTAGAPERKAGGTSSARMDSKSGGTTAGRDRERSAEAVVRSSAHV